jgi:zinc and cadmium transporter
VVTHIHLWILLALVADGLAGLSGGLLPERWLVRHQAALVGFAAGALLGAVFLDILPETIHDFGLKALDWTLLGFIILTVVDWFVGHEHHLDEKGGTILPSTLLSSDVLHNIGDGAALAAGFLLSVRAGVVVALAVIAHEVPHEVGDYTLLRASGWKRTRSLLALAGVQLTAAIGAFGFLLFAERFHGFTAPLLSMSAGSFLYISATSLLPQIRYGSHSRRYERMLGFVCGLGLVVLLFVLVSP